MKIFDGILNRMYMDYVSKILGYIGAALMGSGFATGEQTQQIMGGLTALAAVAWNAWMNYKVRKDIIVIKDAVDRQVGGKTRITSEERRK